MREGRIVEGGPAARLVAEPEHAYTVQLLDAAETHVVLTATGIRRDYPLPRTSLFGQRAVRTALGGVDVALEEGGSLGIVGESGSGKSTLVRILLGLDRATAGEVRYRDRVIEPGKPA